MSVTFFEPALVKLLQTETGAVGIFIRGKTLQIEQDIEGNARDYYASVPLVGEGLASDVSSHMEGSTGVIEINPGRDSKKWGRVINSREKSPQQAIDANRII